MNSYARVVVHFEFSIWGSLRISSSACRAHKHLVRSSCMFFGTTTRRALTRLHLPEASGIAMARHANRSKGDSYSNLARFSWKFWPAGLPVFQSHFSQCQRGSSEENEFHTCVRVCRVEGRGKSLPLLLLRLRERQSGRIHHMQNSAPSWITEGFAILKVVSLVSRLLDREALVHAHQYKS